MSFLEVILWSAVPLNYFFWIVVYPRLENERVPKDL